MSRCIDEVDFHVSPQTMINLKISKEGKLLFYTDKYVKEAMDAAKKALGEDGRIVVRPSGTEPLIRVMVEGSDMDIIEREANKVAEVIKERLGNK